LNWKELSVDTFGTFDGIVSVGAFEHFCSIKEYLAGQQDHVYEQCSTVVEQVLKLIEQAF